MIENTCGRAGGNCSQVVWADGTVNPGDPQVLPITPQSPQLAGSLGTGAQHLLHHPRGRASPCARSSIPLAGTYRYSNGTAARRARHALRRRRCSSPPP